MQFVQMGGCPCGVGLHGTVEVAVLRFSLEVIQHQALKGGTLIADGRALGAELGEEVLQGGHGVFFRGVLIKVLSRCPVSAAVRGRDCIAAAGLALMQASHPMYHVLRRW